MKCYPRDFKTKREEFQYYLPVQTTKHLERIIKTHPRGRYNDLIKAELKRRKENASKI
jgi:hypothetical protein